MRKLVLILAALMTSASAVAADELTDIFTGGSSGGVVPMETVLASARAEVDGLITEIELERKGRSWVYEVEAIASDGRKWELTFDAQTGQRLSRSRR